MRRSSRPAEIPRRRALVTVASVSAYGATLVSLTAVDGLRPLKLKSVGTRAGIATLCIRLLRHIGGLRGIVIPHISRDFTTALNADLANASGVGIAAEGLFGANARSRCSACSSC